MYDCAEQMNIKVEAIRKLGYPEAIIAHYLPGPAPSEQVSNYNALVIFREQLQTWLASGISNIDVVFASSATCPYCHANKATSCADCAYGQAFGECCASEHYDELDYMIQTCEHSPSKTQINEAITYLEKQIEVLRCGQQNKN